MAVTWKITKMLRSPSHNSKSDVVRIVYYTARNEASSGGQQANYQKKGHAVLDVSDLSSFTAFSDVTEANAMAWLHAALGDEKAKIEAELEMQSEFSLSASKVSGLPWYTAESEPTIPPVNEVEDKQTGGAPV